MSHQQENTEGNPSTTQQSPETIKGSKITLERVALLVVGGLLAAAVIVICRLSLAVAQTRGSLQRLRDENEAIKRNFTDNSCLKCDDGWEQLGAKCYYFSTDDESWSDSRGQCQRKGGDLVKIESIAEQVFLDEKVTEKIRRNNDKFWIGLTDSETEGTWLWVDGTQLNDSLTFWNGREPDNSKSRNSEGEDCANMGEKGGARGNKSWFDETCSSRQRYICEKPAANGRLKCF